MGRGAVEIVLERALEPQGRGPFVGVAGQRVERRPDRRDLPALGELNGQTLRKIDLGEDREVGIEQGRGAGLLRGIAVR